MAKVTVDENVCIGCGLCVSTCPDCFEMGEDGKSHAKSETCECNLVDVAADCPAGAIHVEE